MDMYDDRMDIYSPGGMYDGSLIQELDIDVVLKNMNFNLRFRWLRYFNRVYHSPVFYFFCGLFG